MTDVKEKKGFWGGLLRRTSLAKRSKSTRSVSSPRARNDDPRNGTHQRRRASDGDVLLDEHRREPGLSDESPRMRWRPAPSGLDGEAPSRPQTARTVSGKAKPNGKANGKTGTIMVPLTAWPPSGMSSQEELLPRDALDTIARGVPFHKGHRRPIPHVSDDFCTLHTTTSGNYGKETDRADLQDSMVQLMTMRRQGKGEAGYPWQTLEQPSYTFFYGALPGTITLNQWASQASPLPPPIELRDSGVVPREMELHRVFERLKELQYGLEDDDLDLLYKITYKRLLRDPEKLRSSRKSLDKQITDLILVLSRPGHWIDFTDPKNQVVTRFIFDASSGDDLVSPASVAQYHKFFHQLLLSLELELRIQSRRHSDWASEKLLGSIPPSIQWSLALARRWRANVRIQRYGETPNDVRLKFRLKKKQVKNLTRFAQAMKWPNLRETLEQLEIRDEESSLDIVSSDAFAFFSGLVVPGPALPFLTMNTLLDLDPDPATDSLALLSHIHPNCGFQYRNSYTYWSATCIVGKVLAPTCRSLAGWIGPGRPTSDLGRSQIARIRSRKPRGAMSVEDVESMAERSDALGPPAKLYPVSEYDLIVPDREDLVDTVRIELLGLKNAEGQVSGGAAGGGRTPELFDATVQFAINGVSWPLRLMYDVSFISAWPCSDGPHLLFFDYIHERIKVDDIVHVSHWSGLYRDLNGAKGARSARSTPKPLEANPVKGGLPPREDDDEDDYEKVLVVEAFGVRDNEVLARAWCAHWGLSAACAVREAFAATVTVVILIEGQGDDEEVDD
ncbi:hypothetical protein NLU13_7077 [Sarocladium strictum]|uniref:VTC domain-containing protein n=1 Tax=Sarocladium strictum TaxID=5046 RepID=A0AA39GGY2_SARSR|nr:hypothetical protein NLU13_7077 [Sarocladium strictum]